MSTIIPLSTEESLMELSKRCNAVYICPKVNGVRKGPMVAYAGKDSQGLNLIGDIYFNFRRIEEHPQVVMAFAKEVHNRLNDLQLEHAFDTICGVPNGGRTLGQALAFATGKRFVYPTKEPKPCDPGKKQEYTWDLSQFEFEPGERVAIAEDIFNNFQNTSNTLEEIAKTGAEVVLLAGGLNRSPIFDIHYTPSVGLFMGQSFPVVAAISEPYPEYEQSYPEVAEEVAAGNIVYDVKNSWGMLLSLMNTASTD